MAKTTLARARIFFEFSSKSWGENIKLTIGREGFAVPEHFPTFNIFFGVPRLEDPFRRVASLAENFHPLLWIEPKVSPKKYFFEEAIYIF
jgi:hypothetical protein